MIITEAEVTELIGQTETYSNYFNAIAILNGSNYATEINNSYKNISDANATETNAQIVLTAMLTEVKQRITDLVQ
jgi:hypothetical protein